VSEGHRRALSATVARDHRAHGEVRQEGHHRGPRNSLRALVKYLDNIPESEIVELNIPTGIPLVYELDGQTSRPLKHYYLGGSGRHRGGQKAVATKVSEVANTQLGR